MLRQKSIGDWIQGDNTRTHSTRMFSEARRNERSEWLNKAVHQNPLETGKAFIKIFNCDILRAVMREKELLSNGFTPKVNKDLVY